MRVQIWSDVICPWCYIGKRQFEQALDGFEHRDQVEVVYRAFQLDPSFPKGETMDVADMLAGKYGMPREQAVEMNRQMEERAAGVGLEYHLEGGRAGNTADAHRLVHLAAEQAPRTHHDRRRSRHLHRRHLRRPSAVARNGMIKV
ncbi:DsbA family oxidoreductase [Actinomadura sp. 3N407]|uniref:DsbA family oxidoreductase n=1 Tax=Actinomadura sp. 3N407 TaxID=3457423 RepID=UPI003FCE921D